MSRNDLSTFPAGIFGELNSLRVLGLRENNISELPDNLFDELTSLEILFLNENGLSTLPNGVFDELTSLIELDLIKNELSTLPNGIFDELTSLDILFLNENELSELPAGIFDELISLTSLNLSENKLRVLPDNIFKDLVEMPLDDFFSFAGLYLQDNPGAPFKPVVNAGQDLYVKQGAKASLLGSVTGPWGDFIRWEWIQVDGPNSHIPAPDAVSLTGEDTESPSFTAPMEGGNLFFKVVAIPGNVGEATKSFGHANSDPDWVRVRVLTDTNISDPASIVDFALLGNYPNPFTSSTTIQLDLPHRANISVDVFNILGQKVHREEFWGISAGASRSLPLEMPHLPPGVYVYQMTAEMGKTIQRTEGRMTRIK